MLPSMFEVVLGEMSVAIRGRCVDIDRERDEKAREQVEASEERRGKRVEQEEGGREGRTFV